MGQEVGVSVRETGWVGDGGEGLTCLQHDAEHFTLICRLRGALKSTSGEKYMVQAKSVI